MEIKEFYIADARESPGTVYRVQEGREHIFHARSAGNVYSIAFSQDGTLHFVNANDTRIFRLDGPRETVVHTHHTYVRDIAFDGNDTLYFSEATGAGGDGSIYWMQRGNPSLFAEIPLDDIGGYWAGDFAFDTDNNLYISTGNRIPASIYKRNRGWEEIHKEERESIKGFAFLACDFLVFTNWRSHVYFLDIVSDEKTLAYENLSRTWLSDVAFYQPVINEETLYEGTKEYRCDWAFWREDGTLLDRWDYTFPAIDEDNAAIRALIRDIGVPTGMTTVDRVIWERVRAVWAWLKEHILAEDDPNYDAACDYHSSFDRWPSIGELAHMYATYNGFCWGERCTCMCRAQMFATFLCRVGIPRNRIAIVGGRYSETSEHKYVVLRLGCHWYIIDPTSDRSHLGETPENVQGVTDPVVDYIHPHGITTVPGSTLRKPMLIR
jgi:hypothetical protein